MKEFNTLEELLRKLKPGKPIIIMGKPGPTGKTTLCNKLNEEGYKVVEISESIAGLIQYNDGKNHYIESDYYNVIVLNERVR